MENCIICTDECQLPCYYCPQCKLHFHENCYNTYLETNKITVDRAVCCHCKYDFYKFHFITDVVTMHIKKTELQKQMEKEIAKHKAELAYKENFLIICEKYAKLKNIIARHFGIIEELRTIE